MIADDGSCVSAFDERSGFNSIFKLFNRRVFQRIAGAFGEPQPAHFAVSVHAPRQGEPEALGSRVSPVLIGTHPFFLKIM
jgi:hypothetical protein